jgi:amino acid transporter
MAIAPAPPRPGAKGMFKRLFIGRRVASHRLEHTLLPKSLALPVFSSDALSSVAYATEEILAVLLATGLAAAAIYQYVMPIAIAIAALLAIVVASYRQTIRAYPMGGGAYFVSRDNLGQMSGLFAAAALLNDYVLTVAVSITAGVLAITSAFHSMYPYRVWIALGFIAFVTVMNIRGVKESGTLFAIPTYAFIALIATTVVAGLSQCFLGSGCPVAPPVEAVPVPETAAGMVTFFVILRAFSSGSTALTGVEAISDGVQAFRRPQWKNAATTLTIMGVISISMFLGISFLAVQAQAIKSERMTVVAQIANAVYDGGFLFYLMQAFTAAILILAANTAYQDFPRLSSFLAQDRYMPRQFMNRGDRLVFSNGIVGLGLLAGFLVWIFDANLERLIHLYVLGVFLGFTLSQTGMVRHWLREGRKGEQAEQGWRRSIVVNAVGATVTGVVTIVVVLTKFAPEGFPKPGTWMVMVAIVLQVLFFLAVHRHYTSVSQQLRIAYTDIDEVPGNHVVMVITDLDAPTLEAVGYVRTFRPSDLSCLWLGAGRPPADLQERWSEFAPGFPELQVLKRQGSGLLRPVRGYLRAHARRQQDFMTVVVPELVQESLLFHVGRSWRLQRLKSKLLREPNVVVTSVPFLPEKEQAGKGLVYQRVEALVFISSVHNASIRAVNYARSLRPSNVRVIHFALDPDTGIVEEWAQQEIPVSLEVVETPFRSLTQPMLQEVRRATAKGSVAVVVVPQFVVQKWRYWPLHNQDALFMKRQLLYEPATILASVPYRLED